MKSKRVMSGLNTIRPKVERTLKFRQSTFYVSKCSILWFNESEHRHMFHLAGNRFSLDDTDWTGDRKNQLVLIGRNIDHDTVREQLQACVTTDISADSAKPKNVALKIG